MPAFAKRKHYMNEELEVLKIVTHRLGAAGFDYMVSGSVAANYYTVPRMTRDIDIVISLKNADIDKFFNLFQKDFYIDKEMIKEEVRRKGMFNLIHNKLVVKVDFIIQKEEEFNKLELKQKKKVIIEKTPMWFISAEDLILAKLLWAKDTHSEMQLKDIKNLLETVKNLDAAYIKRWVTKLKITEIYKEAKNE